MPLGLQHGTVYQCKTAAVRAADYIELSRLLNMVTPVNRLVKHLGAEQGTEHKNNQTCTIARGTFCLQELTIYRLGADFCLLRICLATNLTNLQTLCFVFLRCGTYPEMYRAYADFDSSDRQQKHSGHYFAFSASIQ